MSTEMIGLLGAIAVIVLICCRVWVGFALALVGFVGLIILRDTNFALSVLGSAPFQNVNGYTMTVLPMFTLMGMFIAESRIGAGLYRVCNAVIGRFRGGLASATVVACGILGAITGGQYGATVIMSKIALPEMRKVNYDDELSCGSIAAGSPLAIIIPPSVPMIAFGILTESSVGKLFIGGLIPGIICVIVFCITIWLVCLKNPKLGPKGPKTSTKEKLASIKGIIPIAILIVVVLVSIYTGVCTTTECGALGAVGAFLIALFMGDVNWGMIKRSFISTAKTTGMIIFLLAGTYVFVNFIAVSKLPAAVTRLVVSLNAPHFVIMLAVLILYFLLGMIMPEIPIMMLTVPILWPAMEALGMSPIWFGVIVVMMLALGGITPPVGMVVYILSGASKVDVMKIFKGCVPFIIAEVIVIFVCMLIPEIVTWLPNMMQGG